MNMLNSLGFDCYVGNAFVGALSYADDIVPLAPSLFALGRVLKHCSLFSKFYQLDFNANKSEFIIHSNNHELHHEEIYFMNKLIQSQTYFTVGSTQREKRVIAATADFNIKTNVLLATFGKSKLQSNIRNC